MRTTTVLLVRLLAVLVLTTTAHAQPHSATDPKRQPQGLIGAELTAIHQCVREIRQNPSASDFDAYVSTYGTIRYDGTRAEIAAFKRCMHLKGFPAE
jgi:hypothetical protein